MKLLRDEKGFTLIELAIVMVIIGIILGAVLKGQDLIQNARSKKFVTWAREWETSQWTYFDRKGRFAGDASKNGLIGDVVASEQTANTNTALGEIANANFSSTPSIIINFGSTSFYMKMGYDSNTNNRNVIVICATDTCGAFTADQLSYLESMDTAIDGIADRGVGKIRSATAAAPTLAGGNQVVTAVTEETATGAWAAGDFALVYYFDR